MDRESILADLRAERDSISAAIAALESLNRTNRRGRTFTSAGRRARRLSPEARAQISAAQKARWAKQKRASRPRPRTSAKQLHRGGITAAGRKRLSEMMKKRWAERKKAKPTE